MTGIENHADIYDSDELCPDCGRAIQIGKLFMNNSTYKFVCPCQEAKIKAERSRNADKGEAIIKSNMRKNSGLLKRWCEKTFDNFIPQEGQQFAYERSMSFASNYKTESGIMLCGAAGCGKTHLASAIVNKIIADLRIEQSIAESTGAMGYITNSRAEHFTPVRFISTVDFLSQVKNTYSSVGGDSESTLGVINKYKTAEVLILDDMGTENMSEWVREKMFEVINYRYGEMLPLVITTNKTPEEYKKDFGNRITDRIREMCVLVPIKAPSQRLTAV